MKCSVCGNESKPDARFCPHCGATLKSAAEGAPASPVPGAGVMATATAPTAAGRVAAPPPRTARVVGLILMLAAIAVAGYFGYRVLAPGERTQKVAAVEAPKPPLAQSAAPVKEAPGPVPAAPEPARADATATPPPAAAPAAEEAKAAAPAGAPPIALAAKPATKARATKAPAATPPAMAATNAPASPPAVPAPAASTRAAPAPAAPPPDRWQMMKDDLARCAREYLFSRVVCEQRVGLKYCEGYWGKVPQCPGKP